MIVLSCLKHDIISWEGILYLQSGLCVESVTLKLPNFLWPTLALNGVNKTLLFWSFFCPWDISNMFCSRLSLVRPWEIGVPADFGVPCELSNCVILLPERVARFVLLEGQPCVQIVCSISAWGRAMQIHTWEPLHSEATALKCIHLVTFWALGCRHTHLSDPLCICSRYPCMPGAVAGTAFCSAGTFHWHEHCSCAVPLYCWVGFCWHSMELRVEGLALAIQWHRYWRLIFVISGAVAQLISLSIADIQSRGYCFLMHSHIVRLICNTTNVNLANLTWNNSFGSEKHIALRSGVKISKSK